MLKLYQEVELKVDSYKGTFFGEPFKLKKGQRGVIVHKSVVRGLPIGYHVEFFNNRGETVALPALEEKYLAPVPQGLTAPCSSPKRRQSNKDNGRKRKSGKTAA